MASNDSMTDEQKKAYAKALIREKEHYERAENSERADQVDKELARIGHAARKPQAKAEKRSDATPPAGS